MTTQSTEELVGRTMQCRPRWIP